MARFAKRLALFLAMGLPFACASHSPRIDRVWERNFEALESLKGPTSVTDREIIEATCFFERLTGIETRVEPTVFGWLVSEEARADMDRIQEWHSEHRTELVWNRGRKRVELRGSADPLLEIAYFQPRTEDPAQVVTLYLNGHLRLLTTSGEVHCTRFDPRAIQEIVERTDQLNLGSDDQRLNRRRVNDQHHIEMVIHSMAKPKRLATGAASESALELISYLDSILMAIYSDQYVEMAKESFYGRRTDAY